MRVFALVDGNNFFVSCERAFNPALEKIPVIVLSSNDGCMVARSNEAKALGIQMGQPVFQIKELIQKERIQFFSSNFELYKDLSNRMMRILQRFSPKIEVYSIDEAFLDFSNVPSKQLVHLGQEIQHILKQGLGLPVSIGFGRTKTLAKVANYFAKHSQNLKGVYVYLNDASSPAPLMLLPIEKVWGIGRSYTHFLKKLSIDTAYKFKCLSESFVCKHMRVVGARTFRELNGHACIPLELVPPVKQTLTVSRALKKATLSYEDVRQAIATHTVQACEKLRSHQLSAGGITAFITSTHHPRRAYYAESASLSLPEATSLTQPILYAALALVEKIFKAGIYYKKVGITLINLVPETQVQKDIFFVGHPHSLALIQAVDQLNQIYGRHTVIFGAMGLQRHSQQIPMIRSPRYSTCATELLCVR